MSRVLGPKEIRETIEAQLNSYNIVLAKSVGHPDAPDLCRQLDKNEHDKIVSRIANNVAQLLALFGLDSELDAAVKKRAETEDED